MPAATAETAINRDCGDRCVLPCKHYLHTILKLRPPIAHAKLITPYTINSSSPNFTYFIMICVMNETNNQ